MPLSAVHARALARPLSERKFLPASAPAAALSGLNAFGVFEGYASLFNIPDLGKDVIVPGAFAASLKARGTLGIRMLWQHDPAQPIGVWLQLVEDRRGLYVRGRLELEVARTREVYALMRDRAVDGLSIGFRTQKSSRDPRTGIRRLEKVDLWEISIVTFPMLPQARVGAVKGTLPRRPFLGSRLSGLAGPAALEGRPGRMTKFANPVPPRSPLTTGPARTPGRVASWTATEAH
jgi:HK97 family phage prohead protease